MPAMYTASSVAAILLIAICPVPDGGGTLHASVSDAPNELTAGRVEAATLVGAVVTRSSTATSGALRHRIAMSNPQIWTRAARTVPTAALDGNTGGAAVHRLLSWPV